ncbi:MAG: hypothetical protein CSB55_07265 [Candidatus Cloacimonadota bacterium]|nr:MAG: hypothetical protein CSB55_07265 [Candidatus Cloacimonadota bacterium]
MNKLLVLFIFNFFIFGCGKGLSDSDSSGKVRFSEPETIIDTLAYVPVNYAQFDDGSFVVGDYLSHSVFKFDSSGKLKAKTGGQGSGPGEYGIFSAFSVKDSLIFIADIINRRITVLEDNLNLKNSFIPENRYVFNMNFAGNSLYALGRTLIPETSGSRYIVDEYKKEGRHYKFYRHLLRIDELPEFIDKNEPGTIRSVKVGDKIYIFCNYSSYVYILDALTNKITEKEIMFPGYISPFNISAKKLNKKYESETGMQNFAFSNIFYWTVLDVFRLKETNDFLVNYTIPWQLRSKYDNKKMLLCVFDENFSYKASLTHNLRILNADLVKGEIELIATDPEAEDEIFSIIKNKLILN